MKFFFFKQYDTMDCGPTCLRMVARFYGKRYSMDYLRQISYLTRQGVSMQGLSNAAEDIGFKTFAAKMTFEELDDIAPLPCIIHWNNKHFVVVPPQNYNRNKNKKILIADPGSGMRKVKRDVFLKSWMGSQQQGNVLLLETTDEFHEKKDDYVPSKTGIRFFVKYLKPYKKLVGQIILSMLIASMVSLIFPFLTQSLVDKGINQKNISFVTMILVSQLVLFTGSTMIDMIRSWIVLHMNTRINITILSDFLIKLMKLPMRFFDTKMVGDIQQRINDHQRIQSFLTGTTISTLFSFVNMIIFVGVLAFYSWKILAIFSVFSVLSVIWIFFFMKKRKDLDYERFQSMSDNQNVMYEMITSMQEIKLNGCENEKRWNWEKVQVMLYKISMKGLALGQYQQSGSFFISQFKNIIISYLSAREVIAGNITFGMMMSISYITGQLNGPVGQILGLLQTTQDAKISLDRITEIHNKKNEEDEQNIIPPYTDGGDIFLQNVSYQYAGPTSPFAVKDINLLIPQGKTTAIVGSSGSGKTTLLKLLLKFYDPSHGSIYLGDDEEFKNISPTWWRSKCGSVMQDGYIFSDTILKNIAVSENNIDMDRIKDAATIANISSYIEELPLQYDTKIGNAGNGLSMGQKQRILIARAVYKNPEYIFFDEATSALDSNNEQTIMDNLERFYKNRTVVVIAHRLSTVKNADQIIVLEKGEIVEIGNHASLSSAKKNYYNLIKNQLALG